MKIPSSIFREYDIRGIVGRDLTPEFAYHLGRAYASYFIQTTQRHQGTIALGRDCRDSGTLFVEQLARGLNEWGFDVLDIGVCPTPLTYFSAFHYKTDGTIMVTGSHNPADYNGFKIGIGTSTLYGGAIQGLREHVERSVSLSQAPTSPRRGTVRKLPIIPQYIEELLKNTRPPLRRMRVVLDAGNGTAGNVAPDLFRKLGAEVIELFCELDGTFPNHHPDPTVHENLKSLIDRVRKEKADFGFAFDGDSDRLGVVDQTGRPFFGDELMVVFARALLQSNPGATVISEVKSSNRLFDDITAHGGKALMWKTGHSLIKSKMKETGALLAGEMSGHIFFSDRYFGFDDGIYAALRFYEIAAASHPAPVSGLISGLPEAFATPELRVDCPDDKKFLVVERVRKVLSKKYPTIDIDGVRADFGSAWGLVRASNTQPVLVLRFEAPSERRLSEIRREVETLVAQVLTQEDLNA